MTQRVHRVLEEVEVDVAGTTLRFAILEEGIRVIVAPELISRNAMMVLEK